MQFSSKNRIFTTVERSVSAALGLNRKLIIIIVAASYDFVDSLHEFVSKQFVLKKNWTETKFGQGNISNKEFFNVGQNRPLFVYFRSILNKMTNIGRTNFDLISGNRLPEIRTLDAQMNPLSYGGPPWMDIFKMGATKPLFVYFRSFHNVRTNMAKNWL